MEYTVCLIFFVLNRLCYIIMEVTIHNHIIIWYT